MNDHVVLQVEALAKDYGLIRAVNGVSFAIRSGEILGLLGPNGAGKSTIINMVLGILKPTAGQITILERNAISERTTVNQYVNFSAVYAHLPLNLTVRQNMEIFGRLYGVRERRKRIEYLLTTFDLERFAEVRSGLLSSGEQSRLSLAKAVINDPKLLLLDEPTASLDPSVAKYVRDTIREHVRSTGTAILWTSHNMREIEEICDRVLFLSHGSILLEGNPRTLAAEYGKSDLEELFITVAREPLSLKDE